LNDLRSYVFKNSKKLNDVAISEPKLTGHYNYDVLKTVPSIL
jgi:hypothetical protein